LVQIAKVFVDLSMPTCGTAVKNGEVLLILGEAYMKADNEMRSLFLEHEACHVALDHTGRFVKHTGWKDGDKDSPKASPQIWNIAADAVIHHRCLDITRMRETDVPGVTFGDLKLPPQPLETAYEALMQKAKKDFEQLMKDLKEKGHGGCEREAHSGTLPEWVASEVAQAVARDVMGRQAGSERGKRFPLGPVQAQPPEWVRQVRAWLERTRGRGRERVRSWLRIGRAGSLLAGRSRVATRTGLILVDCSGSISDKMLNEVSNLLRATGIKPEVVLWAVESTKRLSQEEALHLLKTGTGPGGGTDPREAATYRREGEPSIWITDGLVGTWPRMTQKDLVMWTDEAPPAGVAEVRIRI
jgi:predicted metal-dependent peptidase